MTSPKKLNTKREKKNQDVACKCHSVKLLCQLYEGITKSSLKI